MGGIRIALTIIFLVVCAALVFLVFKGKGEGADLSGGIAGRSADTYFTKHGKKHTEDAIREKATIIAVAIFIVLALLLNMSFGY